MCGFFVENFIQFIFLDQTSMPIIQEISKHLRPFVKVNQVVKRKSFMEIDMESLRAKVDLNIKICSGIRSLENIFQCKNKVREGETFKSPSKVIRIPNDLVKISREQPLMRETKYGNFKECGVLEPFVRQLQRQGTKPQISP